MYLAFTYKHLQTLRDLMAIAEKHNCKLYISVHDEDEVDSTDDATDAFELLKQYRHLDKNTVDEILEVASFENVNILHDYICFELIEYLEDGNTKHHSLQYHSFEVHIRMTESLDELNVSEKTKEDLEGILTEWDDCYICEGGEFTDIYGFDEIDTSFVNVYREGMALKNFGDLVCDYLHEPRIEGRTY